VPYHNAPKEEVVDWKENTKGKENIRGKIGGIRGTTGIKIRGPKKQVISAINSKS
jgi:hypothetical protein